MRKIAHPYPKSARRAAARRLMQRLRGVTEPAVEPEQELSEKPDDHLRLLTLNIAHGRRRGPHQILQPTTRLQRNLDEVAEVLRVAEPDLVALQEADGPSAWSGNFDHVERLSELSELPHFYRGDHGTMGVGRFQLSYGTALLSRQHPLQNPESHVFAENWRDTKGFVVATVPVPQWDGVELDVVSAHLDFLAPSVRRRQVGRMVEVLEARERPLVVLGDLNCSGWEDPRTMTLITRELGLRAFRPEIRSPTYPSIRPLRRLDWILISEELEFSDAHLTLPHKVSDHLPVVADLHPR